MCHADPRPPLLPQTEAVTLQDVRGRDYQNAMRVWSNIPGLKRYSSGRGRGGFRDRKLCFLIEPCSTYLRNPLSTTILNTVVLRVSLWTEGNSL